MFAPFSHFLSFLLGVPLPRSLLPFDMLPSKEKKCHRDLAQETLKFLLLCGYRVERYMKMLRSCFQQWYAGLGIFITNIAVSTEFDTPKMLPNVLWRLNMALLVFWGER